MLGSGLGPEIHKILRPLQDQESKSCVKRLQTILAISTIAEVLWPIMLFLVFELLHEGNVLRAPSYTGCVSDLSFSYGRFWVNNPPL